MRTTLQYPVPDRQQWAMTMCKKSKNSPLYPCLPDEVIIYCILSRLPVKSLLRFSCVSKLWYATFRDLKFIESHLIHAKETSRSTIVGLVQVYMGSKRRRGDYIFVREDGPYFHFHTKKWTCRVGDCNGLFCIRSRTGFEVCNPNTREFLYHRLPPPPPAGCLTSYGFGFDPFANEYKVVQIVIGKGNFHRCMVYTIGPNKCSWRDVTVASKLSNCLNDDALRGENSLGGIVGPDRALYSMRALHWFSRRAFKLVSFDVHDEIFTLFSGPSPESFLKRCRCFLVEWQNSVCIAFHNLHGCKVNLYRLERARSGRLIWNRTVVFLPYKAPSTIGFLGGKSLLYWTLGVGRLWLYSPEKDEPDYIYYSGSETRRFFTLPRSLDSSYILECKYVNHIENLLSLKTLVPVQDRNPVQVKSVSSL